MKRIKLAVILTLILSSAFVVWRFMPHSQPAAVVADDWPSSPDGLEWQFEYDDAGRQKLVAGPGGKTTAFAYEFHETPAGTPQKIKRVTRTTKSGTVVEEFDHAGRRTLMRDAVGLVEYGYDDFGRLAKVERQGVPTLEYEYDSLGRVKRYEIGDRPVVEYVYDFLGRVEAMKTPVGEISYEYLAGQGKVIRKLPNGIRTKWEYEPGGSLKAIVHTGRSGEIAKFVYGYRADGLISKIEEWTAKGGPLTWSYEYDKVQRLIGATNTGGKSWRYQYNEMGNRLSASGDREVGAQCKYDWAGRLTEMDGQPCEHDAAGNLTRVKIAGVERQFEFDDENRLARVNSGEVAYQYDGDGSLIVRSVRAGRTDFVPDPITDIWRPLAAMEAGGDPQWYVWEGKKPLVSIENGKATFFLEDHLGSARCEAEQSGAIKEWRDYTPFGSALSSDGQPTRIQPGFTGLFRDEVAALSLTRNRALGPELGRFLQWDPQHRISYGSQKDLSQYSYCGSDPINYFDVNGAAPEKLQDGNISEDELTRIKEIQIFSNRVDAYINKWIEIYGPGPVVLMVRGMQHRWEDGEAYARNEFPGLRVIVIPSYESPSIFGKNLEPPKVRGLTDLIRTSIDRGGLFRNIDLPHLWQTIEGKGCTIEASIHESGANHDLAKNTASIIAAAKAGQRIPLIVPTSGSIGLPNMNALRTAGVRVNDSVTDKYDFVGKVEASPTEVTKNIPIIGGAAANVPILREGLSTASKLWSAGGLALGGKVPLPGLNYGLNNHAKHQNELIKIVEANRGLDRAEMISASLERFERERAISSPPRSPLDASVQWHGAVIHSSSGRATPEEVAAYKAAGQYKALNPSPVGGVYLGGAGKSLDGMAQLVGVAVDPATGNVVLLADGGREIKLPPLRVDDLVTVFRSVYDSGEGPSVTINPRENDPHGPIMDVVHGKATEDTYVGWVLFEADRLMKCYNLGRDNVTKREFASAVPGYGSVLDTIFFGGNFAGGNNPGGNWERFWIVPSGVRSFCGDSKELTLFDVPLQVKTQKMVLRDGKLSDDPSGQSSAGAKAFIDWFTRNYEGIAQERYLLPPPESGIDHPVPVYSELRRIALLMAIAEQLRDQDVPMPGWMRDHEVAKVPVTPTTPSLTVEKESENDERKLTARIYGGVNLSPADSVVKRFISSPDVVSLPPAVREESRKIIATAEAVAPVLAKAAKEKSFFVPFLVKEAGRDFQAVTLPGADIKALAPCRLSEADLVVPIEGAGAISLTRHFNSFFRPKDSWGGAWTMALPRLNEARIPVRRTDFGVSYQTVSELIEPLGGGDIRFSQVREVPTLKATLHVPDRPCEILALAAANDPLVKDGKSKVIFKDGTAWYFDKDGFLVAEQSLPQTTVFLRDDLGKMRQIAGYLGHKLAATITLEYDNQGRMKTATGKNPEGQQTISYDYDQNGMLENVSSEQGKTYYAYDDGLVKEISWSAKLQGNTYAPPGITRSFDYSKNGQLKGETDSAGRRMSYRIERTGDTSRISTTVDGQATVSTAVTYDAAFRPKELKNPDRSKTQWEYSSDGGSAATTEFSDGDWVKTTTSGDGRQRIREGSNSVKIQEDYDESQRLTQIYANGMPVVSQQWNTNGLLKAVNSESSSVRPQYDETGIMTGVIVTEPKAGERPAVWQETNFDPAGRITGVKDHTGVDESVSYDDAGNVRQLVTKRDGKDYGVSIQRKKEDNRIESVQGTTGNQRYFYNEDGNVARIAFTKGWDHAALEFSEQRLKEVRQFDGGQVRLDYEDANGADRLKSVSTPAIALGYQYSADGAIRHIQCGTICQFNYDFDKQGRIRRLSMTP